MRPPSARCAVTPPPILGELGLGELGQLTAQFDLDTIFGEPAAQDLLDAPLRDEEPAGVGGVSGGWGGTVVEGDGVGDGDAVAVFAQGDVFAAGFGGLAPHAQVVEQLAAALIEALAPGTPVELGGLVDDPHGHSGPGERAGQGEAGGAGARDQHGGGGVAAVMRIPPLSVIP
ncbi:hypothetical protein GCM10020000_23520 [Streptomyces olivoverticillatus]